MKNVMNWFEIYTSDFDRARKFYTTVLQCELTDLPMRSDRHLNMQYATFPGDENGASGGLVKIDPAKPGKGGTLLYFAAEHMDATLGRVETAGGKIIQAKIAIGDLGFIALIEDTEGNMIGLRSTK